MRALLVPLVLVALPAFAQDRGLPHGLAPHERALIPAYRDSRGGGGIGITTPPGFAVRTMAEWEEVQAVAITWTSYTGILKQIVRHAMAECDVVIICDNAAEVTAFLQDEGNGGAITDLSNISFVEDGYDSIWMRDYGPETIYRNEVDTLMLLDWIYNRPRPADDLLSDVLATHFDVPLYSTTQAPYDLVHTGGNFMSDGFGTAFSSNLVLDENGPAGEFNQTVKDEAQVDALMQQFMGITPGRYIKMNTLPYDGIHHIDMHMKLLDEETLLVGEFPVGESDGPQLEENLAEIMADETSVFGTPYDVVRIPMPPSTSGNFPPDASYRTYANNVFINRTVLVPTYRTEYDTTGLRILREALPGYNVVGIDCDNTENIISASGAIHCITKTIGVADPLLIKHQALDDTYETVVPYAVSAYMRHRNGMESARLYWRTAGMPLFQPVNMADQGDGIWAAAIPAQPVGTELQYYVLGESNSGKVQTRPITAPEGWYTFHVLGSTGLAEQAAPAIVEVFPNPTSSILMITLTGTGSERVSVRLLDALGRDVMKLHDGRMPSDRRVFADIAHLAQGTYQVVVQSANGRSTARVLKR